MQKSFKENRLLRFSVGLKMGSEEIRGNFLITTGIRDYDLREALISHMAQEASWHLSSPRHPTQIILLQPQSAPGSAHNL